jgi:hypothetical protein
MALEARTCRVLFAEVDFAFRVFFFAMTHSLRESGLVARASLSDHITLGGAKPGRS